MDKPIMVLLAGGRGTRLGNLTKSIPKPMVPINGTPFLKLLIDRYKANYELVVSVNYLAHKIENYTFGHRIKFIHDVFQRKEWSVGFLLNVYAPCWVLNADTWITTELPDTKESVVLVNKGIDAGAQFISGTPELIKVVKCGKFYDIGTPKGLKAFNDYYKDTIQS